MASISNAVSLYHKSTQGANCAARRFARWPYPRSRVSLKTLRSKFVGIFTPEVLTLVKSREMPLNLRTCGYENGGLTVTAAANGENQIFQRDTRIVGERREEAESYQNQCWLTCKYLS